MVATGERAGNNGALSMRETDTADGMWWAQSEKVLGAIKRKRMKAVSRKENG